MIAPPTAPRPGELCASASVKGIIVASARKNNNCRIRCIGHPLKRIFPGCALTSSQDEKEIRQNALLSLSTSCEATNNPVRAVIECNDDVASVKAALLSGGPRWMLVCDGLKRWRRRDRRSRADWHNCVPSLATKGIGPLSVLRNSMPSGSQQIRPIARRETSILWLRVRSSGRRGDVEVKR